MKKDKPTETTDKEKALEDATIPELEHAYAVMTAKYPGMVDGADVNAYRALLVKAIATNEDPTVHGMLVESIERRKKQ